MKRYFQHITSFLLAIYFLIAGLGFNIINYCCNGCREAGIEYVAAHSCFDVHRHDGDVCCSTNHNSTDDKENTYSITHSHADHCSVNRFNVETPTVSANTQILSRQIFTYVAIVFEVNKFLNIASETENYYLKFPPPLLTLSGRNLLSLKSVLII